MLDDDEPDRPGEQGQEEKEQYLRAPVAPGTVVLVHVYHSLALLLRRDYRLIAILVVCAENGLPPRDFRPPYLRQFSRSRKILSRVFPPRVNQRGNAPVFRVSENFFSRVTDGR